MTQESWSTESRYNTLREFTYDPVRHLLTVVCHNTLYYSWSEGLGNQTLSVDPDGGPLLCVGRVMQTPSRSIKLTKIQSHTRETFSKELRIVFECEEVYASVV